MALTDKQLELIEQGILLAITAVLAAVRTAGETPDAPLDWSKLRITETPEMALEKASQSRAREQAGVGRSVQQEPPLPNGRGSDSTS
jgi:hypothetical protein